MRWWCITPLFASLIAAEAQSTSSLGLSQGSTDRQCVGQFLNELESDEKLYFRNAGKCIGIYTSRLCVEP